MIRGTCEVCFAEVFKDDKENQPRRDRVDLLPILLGLLEGSSDDHLRTVVERRPLHGLGGSATVGRTVLLSRLHQARHHRQDLRAAEPATPARDEVHDALDRNDVGLAEA